MVITTGGTGITSRDTTYEAMSALLEKRLDGFGELFRMLSYAEIGAAAMLSRATAGLAHGCIVAALPGSEAAVRLAMEKLLLPELGHLVQQATEIAIARLGRASGLGHPRLPVSDRDAHSPITDDRLCQCSCNPAPQSPAPIP